jgi:quercetin dioxygenase-like cupin family protein
MVSPTRDIDRPGSGRRSHARHDGHMHVAAGTVRVTVGDETVELSGGDSCSCRTDAPHGVENPDPSAEALIYLIVERG